MLDHANAWTGNDALFPSVDACESASMQSGDEVLTGEDVISPAGLLSRQDSASIYPLWKVLRNNRHLKLSVYSEDGCWFAENEYLNISGTGSTAGEAMNDAEEHIRHFVEYYRDKPESKLMGLALRLKERFSRIRIE